MDEDDINVVCSPDVDPQNTDNLESSTLSNSTVKTEETIAVTDTQLTNVKAEPSEDNTTPDDGEIGISVQPKGCDNCSNEYDLFCPTCTTLSHILDNSIYVGIIDRARRTVPKDILEIKLNEKKTDGVFALRCLPRGVNFGPFEGLDMVERAAGYAMWRIRSGHFVRAKNTTSLTWMEYVNCARNFEVANLSIFQYNGKLYYRAEKEINVGEELLMYLVENGMNLSGERERYHVPMVELKMKSVYACAFCCLGFESEENVDKHKSGCLYPYNTDSNEGIIQCGYCKFYMDKGQYLQFHMVACQEKIMINNNSMLTVLRTVKSKDIYKKYGCGACQFTTNSLNNLKKHKNIHNKPFKCKICTKTFSSSRYRKRHMEIHQQTKDVEDDKVKALKCCFCGVQPETIPLLVRHSFVYHRKSIFVCNVCNHTCKSKKTLLSHVQNIHFVENKRFKCVKCNYQTDHKSSLIVHSYQHSGRKPFVCEICARRFTSQGYLTKHRFCHVGGGGEPFGCNLCGRRYSSERSLKQHMLAEHEPKEKKKPAGYPKSTVESNQTNYFECQRCKKRFRQKSNLTAHCCISRERKLFECPICEKQFKLKEYLNRHESHHIDSKPYECDVCKKSFGRKETLKVHRRIHMVVKRFQCGHCDFQCNRKLTLDRHTKTEHDIIVPENAGDEKITSSEMKGEIVPGPQIKIEEEVVSFGSRT